MPLFLCMCVYVCVTRSNMRCRLDAVFKALKSSCICISFTSQWLNSVLNAMAVLYIQGIEHANAPFHILLACTVYSVTTCEKGITGRTNPDDTFSSTDIT